MRMQVLAQTINNIQIRELLQKPQRKTTITLQKKASTQFIVKISHTKETDNLIV